LFRNSKISLQRIDVFQKRLAACYGTTLENAAIDLTVSMFSMFLDGYI
jgi:hypothetical protein